MKLTKSLPIIKERNCNASLVLDTRTNRKNVSIRFTVDRKFFYHQVGGFYSEKRFSDICTATKSSSENYKEQKMWREDIVPKYKKMLVGLNKGNPFTYEMVRVAVTTGNANVEVTKEDKSFIGIWQEYIYHLQNNDNGKRYSTSDNYISALNSFQKFLGKDAINTHIDNVLKDAPTKVQVSVNVADADCYLGHYTQWFFWFFFVLGFFLFTSAIVMMVGKWCNWF